VHHGRISTRQVPANSDKNRPVVEIETAEEKEEKKNRLKSNAVAPYTKAKQYAKCWYVVSLAVVTRHRYSFCHPS
jgi:hypothetical protein